MKKTKKWLRAHENGAASQPEEWIVNITYQAAANAAGTFRVLRREQDGTSTCGSLIALPPGIHRTSPDCAAQLAFALLSDCLADVPRARRLQQALADLLVSPLLLRSNCTLTSEDIEDVVRAIDDREGWLWLEEG
jgi:hypothetical protein